MKLQKHNLKVGNRILCLYEGRDGSGKGSCIKAFNEHMNPRNTRTVALPKPTETERGQLYFQRYAVHLPTAGAPVFHDYLSKELEAIYGGKWDLEADPIKHARLMIAHIDKKRKELGIDKARERVLMDMADRQALEM